MGKAKKRFDDRTLAEQKRQTDKKIQEQIRREGKARRDDDEKRRAEGMPTSYSDAVAAHLERLAAKETADKEKAALEKRKKIAAFSKEVSAERERRKEHARPLAQWMMENLFDEVSHHAAWWPKKGMWFCKKEPIAVEVIERCFLQNDVKSPVGAYFISNQLVKHLCFDIDAHNPGEQAEAPLRKMQAVLEAAGIPYTVARSKGGKGYHVRIRFQRPLPAHVARNVGVDLLKAAGLPADTEVNPKQESLREGEYGNQVAIPGSLYFYGQSCGLGSTFVDPNSLDPIPFEQWLAYLQSVPALSEDRIREIYAPSGVDAWESRKPEKAQYDGPPVEISAEGLPEIKNVDQLTGFLASHGIEVVSSKGAFRDWTDRLLLARCPNKSAHADQTRDDGAAVMFDADSGRVGFKCHFPECSNGAFSWPKLLKKLGYRVHYSGGKARELPPELEESSVGEPEPEDPHEHGPDCQHEDPLFSVDPIEPLFSVDPIEPLFSVEPIEPLFSVEPNDPPPQPKQSKEKRPKLKKEIELSLLDTWDKYTGSADEFERKIANTCYRIATCGQVETVRTCAQNKNGHGGHGVIYKMTSRCENKLCQVCFPHDMRTQLAGAKKNWPSKILALSYPISGPGDPAEEAAKLVRAQWKAGWKPRLFKGTEEVLVIFSSDDEPYVWEEIEESVSRGRVKWHGVVSKVDAIALVERVWKSEHEHAWAEYRRLGDFAQVFRENPWLLSTYRVRTTAAGKSRELFPWTSKLDVRNARKEKWKAEHPGLEPNECPVIVEEKEGKKIFCGNTLTNEDFDTYTHTSLIRTRRATNEKDRSLKFLVKVRERHAYLKRTATNVAA